MSAALLKVFCARSMQVAVTTLSRQFTTDAGAAPDIVFEPMGALQARIAAGETADVLILAAPVIDALAKSGAIVSDSRVEVARAPIGVAIRDGAPEPDIATPEAFKAALIAARTIALSDPAVGGSAGIYLRDLFGHIGLSELIAAKTVRQKSGVAAGNAVGRGEAELAMTFIPELLQGKGARILGPLPPPYGHVTSYAAGVSGRSNVTDVARAFIAVLTAPSARAIWIAAGFEVGQ
jgi:molybdate transport system substrate-binding protein